MSTRIEQDGVVMGRFGGCDCAAPLLQAQRYITYVITEMSEKGQPGIIEVLTYAEPAKTTVLTRSSYREISSDAVFNRRSSQLCGLHELRA